MKIYWPAANNSLQKGTEKMMCCMEYDQEKGETPL